MAIFAHETYCNKKILIEEIVSYYVENQISVNEQFDFICCLDGTFIVNSSKKLQFFYENIDGFVVKDLKEDVLYYFLYFLINIPESAPLMSDPVLKPYLKPPPNENWFSFHNLNENFDLLKMLFKNI